MHPLTQPPTHPLLFGISRIHLYSPVHALSGGGFLIAQYFARQQSMKVMRGQLHGGRGQEEEEVRREKGADEFIPHQVAVLEANNVARWE